LCEAAAQRLIDREMVHTKGYEIFCVRVRVVVKSRNRKKNYSQRGSERREKSMRGLGCISDLGIRSNTSLFFTSIPMKGKNRGEL